MCRISRNYTIAKKTYIGYKVVIVDKYGHYYSPFTGIRYKAGPVQAKDIHSLKSKYIAGLPIDKSESMSGYTGVLTNLTDARKIFNYLNEFNSSFKYKIITMKISTELKYGIMGICTPVIVGKQIISIESLKL